MLLLIRPHLKWRDETSVWCGLGFSQMCIKLHLELLQPVTPPGTYAHLSTNPFAVSRQQHTLQEEQTFGVALAQELVQEFEIMTES